MRRSAVLLPAAFALLSIAPAGAQYPDDPPPGDPGPGGMPTASIAGTRVQEGNSGTREASLRISLSAPSAVTVSVSYEAVRWPDGTATPHADFHPTSGMVAFAPGETAKTVSVEVIGETRAEPNEAFYVHLAGATNATVATHHGKATILDDDGGCTVRGSNRANVLRGTARRDVICGFGGNDVIRGLGGNDRLLGGPGNDRLIGGAGRDALLGEAGADTLVARDRARDTVSGGRGRDRASVDRGLDVVRGVEALF
jgi:Ca2+-binding RTX toxin-like protein